MRTSGGFDPFMCAWVMKSFNMGVDFNSFICAWITKKLGKAQDQT